MTEQEFLQRHEEYSKQLLASMKEQGIHEKKFYVLHENTFPPPAEDILQPGPENRAALEEFNKGCDIFSSEEISLLRQGHS